MKKEILLTLFLLLFTNIVLAQQVTIGVQPSELILDFYKYKTYDVEFLFFNEKGDINATYQLSHNCTIIKEYPSEILVPKGTKRTENPVRRWIKFEADFTGNQTCFLRISVKPPENVTIAVKPQVSVRIIAYQPEKPIEYTNTQTEISQGSQTSPFFFRLILVILVISVILLTIFLYLYMK
jgi:hypothetical protein